MDPHPDPPWIHTFIRPRNVRSANFAPRTALRKFKQMHSIPIALTPPNLTSTPKT